MPLPQDSLILRGGCSCRAIRYKIDIPPASERPFRPPPDNLEQLPFILFCHCDDCRRATAGLVLSGIYTPTSMVTVSLLSCSPLTPSRVSSHNFADREENDARREWIPASEVFAPGTAPEDSFLTTYKSSEKVYRTFCRRCGTPLTCSMSPMPEKWPDMLDIMLGSIDREDLEKGYMVPDRQFWWNSGIAWFQKLYDGGERRISKHPSSSLSETVE